MKAEHKTPNLKYELSPPEGGWGYMIAAALTIGINCTVIPMACFGLIFGKFLAGIGDETTGTTLANGIFNTCFNITGLAANSLLQKYTYRKVAVIGSCIFFVGSFATIFVQTLPQLIFSFGVIQGLGMGLLFPALFTALSCYFDKKLTLVNSVAQVFMVAAMMIFPYIGQYLMSTYGFRGTVAVISAMSLNAIFASLMLQPVEWHLKKSKITKEKEELLVGLKPRTSIASTGEILVLPKARASIISIGDRALSVTTINRLGKMEAEEEKKSWFKSVAKTMDLGIFTDPTYVNISMGLSLGFTADVAFISILPMVLLNSGLDTNETAFLMSVFFASDLAARILLSVVSAVCRIRNRYVFLAGAAALVVCRTAFVLRNDFYWKVKTVSALGFLRCFIQTPLPVVISEQYPDNFSTAFSLYMVVCGVVSLIFGPLMSFVKSQTRSDVMVVHLLTLAYLTCVISWSVELVYKKIRRSK